MAMKIIGKVVGKSAYEIAVEKGFVGTEATWLESLKGPTGPPGSGGGGQAAGIPKVYLVGSIASMTKDVAVNLEFKYEGVGKTVNCFAKVKWQGTSSIAYPKKNYTFDLYTDNNYTTKKNTDLNNWGNSSKFNAKANYIDVTHARNVVNSNLWKELSFSRASTPDDLKKAPNFGVIDGFPIEIYINGSYKGVYTMNIPKSGWMFGMDSANPNHIAIIGEHNTAASSMFNGVAKVDKTDWGLEFPDVLSTAGLNSFNAMITFVRNGTEATFKANLSNYLNVQATIDYYIFTHAINNLDGLAKNMMMLTYDGVIWMPSAYDLDSTWSLWWDGSRLVSDQYRCPEDFEGKNSLLWQKMWLFFKPEIQTRYAEVRKTVLSNAHILGKFESFINKMDSSDYERDLATNPGIPSKNITNIRQLRQAIFNRLAYSDSILLAGYVAPTNPTDPTPTDPTPTNPSETFANFVDEFDRFDGNGLGGSWVLSNPLAFKILNGRAYPMMTNASLGNDNFALIEMTSSNVTIESTLSLANSWCGLALRFKDKDNCLRLDAVGTNMRFLKRVSGVESILATIPTVPNTPIKVELSLSGTTIVLKKDGIQVFTGTVSDSLTNKKFGLAVTREASMDYFENFKCSVIA